MILSEQQKIDMLNALSKVVEANRGLMGNERVARKANKKIEELLDDN